MIVSRLRLPIFLAAGLTLATASIAAGPPGDSSPEPALALKAELDPIWGKVAVPQARPAPGDPVPAPPAGTANAETANGGTAEPVTPPVEPPPPLSPPPWAALASEAAQSAPAAKTDGDAGDASVTVKPPGETSPTAGQTADPETKASDAVSPETSPPAEAAPLPEVAPAAQTAVPEASSVPTQGPEPAALAGDKAPSPPSVPIADSAIVPLDTPGLPTHAFTMAVDKTADLTVLTHLQIEEEELALRLSISGMRRQMAENDASIAEAAYKKRAADADKPLAVTFGPQVLPLNRQETAAPSQPEDPLGTTVKPAGDGQASKLIATPESGPVVLEVIGRGTDLIATIQMPSGRLVIGRAGDTLPDDAGQIASVTSRRVEIRHGQAVKPLIFADELAR